MYVIAEFSVIPIGMGVSLSGYVAACERVLQDTDLEVQLHANGTNLAGEWDEVMAAIKRCHETLHSMGVPRIATQIKVGTRTDREESMVDKVHSVESKLT
jgi:uncharacterized protein (TIGR00106 family)